MPSIRKVAVAGINGSLGSFVLEALVRAGFDVLVVTRDTEKTAALVRGFNSVNVVEAQYVKDQLVPILRGQDAVVSLISRLHPEPQNILADAAADAGVARLLPSYWGVDIKDPEVRSNPALEPKVQVEEHVEKLAATGRITYTGIHTAMFFDWALERGIFLNFKETTMVINGGDIPIATTARIDIANAVVAVLKDPDAFENKVLCIQSTVFTQNKLLRLAKEALPDHDFKTVDFDSQIAWNKSQEAYDRGERSAEAVRGFLLHGTYGQGHAVHPRDDSAALGVQQWSDEKIKALLVSVFEGPGKPALKFV